MRSRREVMLAHAAHYVFRYGLSVIPIGENKKPTIKWAHLQERHPRIDEMIDWEWHNLAILTGEISNICVIDCDSRQGAEFFWQNRGQTPVTVRTKRGVHFYFRHPGGRVRNDANVEGHWDVRGDGGYVLAPPSSHSEGEYEWTQSPMIQPVDLPVFNVAWRPDNNAVNEKKITDGEAYISQIHAIEGQAGSNQTYRAVASLKDAGFSEGEAVMAMQRWNETNAHPPWSDNQLLHKIRSVYK